MYKGRSLMEQKLVLFDFDGTITRSDSFRAFLIFSLGYFKLIKGLVVMLPVLLRYLFKQYTNEKAKEIIFGYLYKDWTDERFRQCSRKFAETALPRIVRKSAIKRIRWHREQGHTCYVVTASLEVWLDAWCEEQKLGLIATRAAMADGKFTGKFLTRNCYGAEKEQRIREAIDLSRYSHVYAYGDSRGDKQMLALADEPHYRYFK